MDDPEQKALAFNSCAREIRGLAPADRFAALLAALPADTRALVERPPLPIEWLPYRHSWALMRKAHEIVFDGDEQRAAEIGRRAVRSDLNVVHKVVLRFATPEWVIARAARLWDSYWRNNGWVEVERLAQNRVRVRYQGMQRATPLFWEVQGGTLRGLAEATGVTDIEVAVVEGKKSPSRCAIEIGWR